MIFLKLTDNELETPIIVPVERIEVIYVDRENHTTLVLKGSSRAVVVKETAEAIWAHLLEGAQLR